MPTFDSSSEHVPNAGSTTELEMQLRIAGFDLPMSPELNNSGALYGEAEETPI
jgi:hypothetical protein